MAKFILNIQSGIIHSGDELCAPCKNMKLENKKVFETYEEAKHYYNGNKVGSPCGRCMKEGEPKE